MQGKLQQHVGGALATADGLPGEGLTRSGSPDACHSCTIFP